jgi:drug/metabolite transporter (DMT)-like permease
MSMPERCSNTYLPVLSCLFAAILWGVLWYPVRVLEQMGMPGLWSTLVIYISALFPFLPILWSKRNVFVEQPWLLFMIGLFSGWTNLSFILAVLDGTVVRVLLLFYLSPVWATLLACLFLQERLSFKAWFSLIMSLTGAVFILWTDEIGIWMPVGKADILAISSGFAFAVTNILVRKAQQVPIFVKMVTAWVGVILLSLSGIVLMKSPVPILPINAYVLAISLGMFGMVVMTWSAQYGVTHLPVHRSAVIFEFEVVVGAVSAAMLTNEVVTLKELVGGILVMLAAWLIARDSINQDKHGHDSYQNQT